MTLRQVFENVLSDLNKREAPSLLREDFNYFWLKSVGQFINKIYNIYDTSQQTTDDLRVLKSTVQLTPVQQSSYGTSALLGNTYDVTLPDDYLHILGCIVEYTVNSDYLCYKAGDIIQFAAKKATSDMYPQLINNYYFKPTYKNPYYFINNVTTTPVYPTVDDQQEIDYTPLGTEPVAENINRVIGDRYGNKNKVKLEIRFGKSNNVFTLSKVYVDYLKSPQHLELTEEHLEDIEDNSPIIEFPDYVIQQIINELVGIIMEHDSNPRLQTNIPINQSIARPGNKK
jgi:hypothetical protein